MKRESADADMAARAGATRASGTTPAARPTRAISGGGRFCSDADRTPDQRRAVLQYVREDHDPTPRDCRMGES